MLTCATCPIGVACGTGEGRPCAFVPRRRPAGDRLYREGETAEAVWFIRSGTVALVRSLPGGGEGVRAVRGPGTLVGLEVVAGGEYVDTARALEEVTVCGLGRTALDAWLGDRGTPARALLRLAARDLVADPPRGAGPDGTAERRVARWILAQDSEAPSLPRRVVANLLGMTPETLSRTLATLRRAGAIVAGRKSITIRNHARLLHAAGLADDM